MSSPRITRGHVFQFVQRPAPWRGKDATYTVVGFTYNRPNDCTSGVIYSEIAKICHVNATGNDYCLVKADKPGYHVWEGPGGQLVQLASVHGTGEVRWTYDANEFKWHNDPEDATRKELNAVKAFFGIEGV